MGEMEMGNGQREQNEPAICIGSITYENLGKFLSEKIS